MSSSSDTKKPGGIQVICAGLGRTGTLSLTEALQVLGYKPYHYVDFGHAQQWAQFSRGGIDTDSIIDLIVQDGYTATLDNPTSDIFLELLERFPNAKVILTVRDSPEAFERSWKTLLDTMVITEQDFSFRFPSFFQWIPLFRHLKETRQFMGTTHLGLPRGALTNGWRNQPDGWLAEQYEWHNHIVQEHVPKKQLLVFNVKQGWAPLCAFLDKDVPKDIPFPHSKVNDTEALRKMKWTFLIAVYSWIPLVVSIGAGVAWYSQRSRQSVSRPASLGGGEL